MSVSVTVLVRPSGLLSGLACALGLHDRSTTDSEAGELSWCNRCGACLVPGWSWIGTVHQHDSSLVAYRAPEGPA